MLLHKICIGTITTYSMLNKFVFNYYFEVPIKGFRFINFDRNDRPTL